MILNEPKNPSTKEYYLISKYSKERHPDDDFIDIMALAQNMVVDFAEKEDAQCWLTTNSELATMPHRIEEYYEA